MSSTLGGSEIWSTSAALAWMVVVVWVCCVGALLVVILGLIGLVEFWRRDAFALSCIRFGDRGVEFSAFYSGGWLSYWPSILHGRLKFVYCIDYKFGGFVYVADGDFFGIEELL